MASKKELRIATGVVGALPIAVMVATPLVADVSSDEPPFTIFIAVFAAFAASILAGVTATKTGRRWWPWSIGALFLYGIPAVILSFLTPRDMVEPDLEELARLPLPDSKPWFIASGVVFLVLVVARLAVEAAFADDPTNAEIVGMNVSMIFGFPMLILLLVGVSKRGKRKKIEAARAELSDSENQSE